MSAVSDDGIDIIRSELLSAFIQLAKAEADLQTNRVLRTPQPKRGDPYRKLTTVERSQLTEACAAARRIVQRWGRAARHRASAGAYETAELLVNTAQTATLRELHDGIDKLVAEGALR